MHIRDPTFRNLCTMTLATLTVTTKAIAGRHADRSVSNDHWNFVTRSFLDAFLCDDYVAKVPAGAGIDEVTYALQVNEILRAHELHPAVQRVEKLSANRCEKIFLRTVTTLRLLSSGIRHHC